MPIAIIGMGCRCPGDATNPENLWDLVSEARSAWSPVPKEMYNAEAFYHPNASRHGSVSSQEVVIVHLLIVARHQSAEDII